MNLVGRKPAFSLTQATRVRTIVKRRQKLKAQIVALKAELRALPTDAKLAAEYDVHITSIRNTAHERFVKHHTIEARSLEANNQEQPTC